MKLFLRNILTPGCITSWRDRHRVSRSFGTARRSSMSAARAGIAALVPNKPRDGTAALEWRRIAHALRALILASLLQFSGSALALARPVQIWFAPMDSFVRPEVGFGGSIDYMDLFSKRAESSVLSQIDVFKIYGQFADIASDDDLKQVFAELTRRKVALAAELGILTATERCGEGVEGYGGEKAARLAARIARLGGILSYIAMDEPAWHGHIFAGTNACRADIGEVARNAAINLAAVKAIFPQVHVGDTEPIGFSPDDSTIAVYAQWADAFRAATGDALAFSQADVVWRNAWREPLEKWAAAWHERKIPFGVIYNGDEDATSDDSWVAQAEAHWRAVEADERIRPDLVVLQSWAAHPTHLLPDTDPATFTYLLQHYLRQHPR